MKTFHSVTANSGCQHKKKERKWVVDFCLVLWGFSVCVVVVVVVALISE